MAATINTNTASLIAQLNLSNSKASLQTSVQRLSSGLRINSAADDAAGLAIATRMNSQIQGMGVAMRNANDGISLAQTADGALSSVSDALQRMRELAVQSRNATNGSSDRNSLDQEFGQLADEVQRVLGGTTFNGQNILGANAGTQAFQVGAGTTSNDLISVTTTRPDHRRHHHRGAAGTDNAGTGRAADRQHCDHQQPGQRDRQHRFGHRHHQQRARPLRRHAEPFQQRRQQPAGRG